MLLRKIFLLVCLAFGTVISACTMVSKKIKFTTPLLAAIFLLQSCAIIRPGEVALDVHYGKIRNGVLLPGRHHVSVLGTRVVRFDSRVINYSQKLKFPTKEGIEVTTEITLLYHLIPDSLKSIYMKFGKDYQTTVIEDNLIHMMRQTGLNYKATDLITERSSLETTIKEKLSEVLGKYGFTVDLILLKDIDLPADVVQTIQSKLNAEELSKKTEIDLEIKKKNRDYDIETQKKEAELEIEKQRLTLDFAIEKQKKENERLLIESEAIKKSQDILNASITDKLIRFKALDITRDLVKSANSKIIITDGKSPILLNENNK